MENVSLKVLEFSVQKSWDTNSGGTFYSEPVRNVPCT